MKEETITHHFYQRGKEMRLYIQRIKGTEKIIDRFFTNEKSPIKIYKSGEFEFRRLYEADNLNMEIGECVSFICQTELVRIA